MFLLICESGKCPRSQKNRQTFGNLRTDDSPDGGQRKRCIVRITWQGRKRDFGVGGADKVRLKLARQKRDESLAQLKDGLDPVEEKRKAREETQKKKAAQVTFRQAAEAAYKVISPGWKKGSTSPAACAKTINQDCKNLHRMPVAEITEDHVWSVIEPFVARNNLVAAKLALNRIHYILGCAKAHKWRSRDNPASWDIFQFKISARPNGGKRQEDSPDDRMAGDAPRSTQGCAASRTA
jgi:hypothetical protein